MTVGSPVPALLLDEDLSLTLGTRRLPELQTDDALIRVSWAGLCGSDLHVLRTGAWVQQWPATLGHEICGVVEQAPSDGSLQAGDLVVADSRVPCGACEECRAGEPDRCLSVQFVGECRPGGFATHCVLPSRLLHRAPPELPAATAVLAEPLAVALHAISRLPCLPDRVAIIGHGPLGALLQIELRRRIPDAQIVVAEPTQLRAELARALGAVTVADAAEMESGAFDTVIDAAGYAAALPDALRLVRPRGQVLLLALGRGTPSVNCAELVEREVTVLGSNAFVDELPQALALLAEHPGLYDPVISDAVTLLELPAKIRSQLRRPDAVKVVVCP